jgi:outer membrane protein assembly factor BamD (BamD/ComL family)
MTTDDADSASSYLAAEQLLENGEFKSAIPHLTRCIDAEEATNDYWYRDAAYLLRAYCAAKSGDKQSALNDLENYSRINPDQTDPDYDSALFWITADPVISVGSVRRMLSRPA